MVTAEGYPSAGDARIAGLDLLTQQQQIKEKIGYCPQFDAVQGTLTAREHLVLFSRIKLMKEEIIPSYVQSMIQQLGLQEGIEDRPCKGYSGGNLRKLSLGLALVGNPSVVIMDEPSTGVDPASRRRMWDFISHTMKGRSAILTTHSMEEVVALCQRIGIMVGGTLRCLGSPQRLQSLYGQGYQLDVTIAPEHRQPFQHELVKRFKHARLIEAHDGYLKYEIPKQRNEEGGEEEVEQVSQGGGGVGGRVTIASVFRLMETLKLQFEVREYAVSETSLEQIFIHFAKQQHEERVNDLVDGAPMAPVDVKVDRGQ
jgi:ABC-type multidrug transport system ATPase subunit